MTSPVWRSPATTPYAGRDVQSLLAERARQFGDKPFLIWEPLSGEPQAWTYAQFDALASRLALGLQRRGVALGDFVLIHLENCPEALIAWHACARLGAVAVTTNTRSSPAELAYFAQHSAPVAAITQPKFAALVREAAKTARFVVVTEQDGDSTGEQGPRPDPADAFSRYLDEDVAELVVPPADPWRPLSVQYTSGTTSRPKGVLWTNANGLWGAEVSARHEGLAAQDVHFVHLPLFHTNAQIYSVMASLWVGATVVLTPRFSASRFWDISLRNRCTWSSMIPFCVKAIQSQPVPKDHAYRWWAPAVAMTPLEPHFGVKTMGWWGMTETVTHGILTGLHDVSPFRSIGRCAPEYEIAILREDGTPCAEGETGELLIRGVPGLSLFHSYLHNPEATAAAFDVDGYMITGDRVTLGEGGHLFFADRAKDMLKVGGENVAASEIEAVLAGVPGVAEAAVVAKPDPMLDEVPAAFIIAHPGVAQDALREAIFAACKAALADFKQVREVHFVEEFPRATLEKVAKAELKRRLMEGGA